jgi:hypothetical protein
MKSNLTTLIFTALTVGALALVGCGSAPDPQPEPQPSAPPPAAQGETTPASVNTGVWYCKATQSCYSYNLGSICGLHCPGGSCAYRAECPGI